VQAENSENTAQSDFYISPKSTGEKLLFIQHEGNIGVGTDTPRAELDVGGHINADSTYRIRNEKVLSYYDHGNILVGRTDPQFAQHPHPSWDGRYNICMGDGAGESLTAGFSNVLIGERAGASLDGFQNHNNVMIGYASGKMVAGLSQENTFVGAAAGTLMTFGYANTFVGAYVWPGTEASDNVAVGSSISFRGDKNVLLGHNTGGWSPGGLESYRSIAIGHEAGRTFDAQDKSIFIGCEAGDSTYGSGNILIGFRAGHGRYWDNELVIGNDKTSLLLHGNFDTDQLGVNQDVLDATLHVNATSSDNNLLRLDADGSNRLLMNFGGQLGIGTTSPQARVDVRESVRKAYLCSSGQAVYGEDGADEYGYIASSSTGRGVSGYSTSGYGVYGESASGNGVRGVSTSSHGIYGTSTSGYAGFFSGNVWVAGAINKAACSFVIDHPQDPENKTLRHTCIESPEALVVYRGKVDLNGEGEAVVELPGYFVSLTKEDEATITLTSVGKPFLTGYEWESDFTSFVVYGDPGREVSWVVYADRDDPVIHQLARPVEEMKGPDNKFADRGELLYPTAYDYPETMGIEHEGVQTD
jgi:hypothetical protein